MNQKSMRRLISFMTGLAGGAAAMYSMDPQGGRRRRALARDRLVHAARVGGDFAYKKVRNLANRTRGRVLEMRARQAPGASDEVLVERVRSQLGHVASSVHQIEIHAHNGLVVLSGRAPITEIDDILSCVVETRGVRNVRNELVPVAEPVAEMARAV